MAGVTARIRASRREVRFLLCFAGVFILLETLYYFAAPFAAPFVQTTLNADVAAWLIRLFTPGEGVSVAGPELIGPVRGALRVGTGCDGAGAMILLISAIVAYPASVRSRLAASVLGVALLYGVNLARIVALYYSWQYRPGLFEVLHVYVGQGLVIMTGVLFFGFWIGFRDGERG